MTTSAHSRNNSEKVRHDVDDKFNDSAFFIRVLRIQLDLANALNDTENLQENEEMYRISTEYSLDGVALSEERQYVYVNNAQRD